MSRCGSLKILFIAQIFFGVFHEIITDEDIFGRMSFEDKRKFFGTPDDSVPEYQTVELENRHLSQGVLKIPFNAFGKMTTVYLNIIEDDDLIGPRTTGIWFAKHDSRAFQNVAYTPRPDIFESIGDFHCYQNGDEGAAITVFEVPHSNSMVIGVLYGSYIVKSVARVVSNKLKKRSLEYAVKTGSTNSTNDRNNDSSILLVIFRAPNMTQMHSPLWNGIQSARSPRIDRRRRDLKIADTPDVVYPKLLISADYQLVRQSPDAESFVRDLIAYLNIVDMMYRRIDVPRIRLTITGIILAQDELAMPYVARNPTGEEIKANETLQMTAVYFYNDPNRFLHDDYDIVIALVENTMTGLEADGVESSITGYSFVGSACHERDSAAVLTYSNENLSHFTFVHELAHLFNVTHDRSNHSNVHSKDDCIMSTVSTDRRKPCWSNDSRDALRSFFRFGNWRCMQKQPNKRPDSVKSMQGTWLSLAGQCLNKLNNTERSLTYDKHCVNSFCENENLRISVTPMKGSMGPSGKRCIDGVWK